MDDAWAEALQSSLIRLHIPADTKPPIDDKDFINLNPKDDWVSPVFRDFEVLPAGREFNQKIVDALKYSRKLVVILTDEMLSDQDSRLKGSAHDAEKLLETRYIDSWCYREIFIFLQNHTRQDIIPVYIGDRKEVADVLPCVLTGGFSAQDYAKEGELSEKEKAKYDEELQYWKDQNIVFVDSEKAKSEDIYDIVAAKVAGNIFGTFADQFDNYRKAEERKRQAQLDSLRKTRLLIILGSVFSIILLTLILMHTFQNKRRAEAFRELDKAKWEYDGNNVLTAMKLSSSAMEKDKKNQDGILLSTKLLSIDYSKPVWLMDGAKVGFLRRSHEFYEFDGDRKKIVLRDSRFHETGEQIDFKDLWFYPISSSEDRRLLAIPDYDSVYVYDRGQKSFIYATPYDGGWRDNLGEVVFDGSDRIMVRMRPTDVHIHDLEEKTTTVLPCSYEKVFLSDSDVCLARIHSDSLIIEKIDPLTHKLSIVQQWALPAGSSKDARETLTVSPNGKELIAWTDNRILRYTGDRIEFISSTNQKPSKIAFDDTSERMAIIYDGGRFIDVFRNHRFEYEYFRNDGKKANEVSWGRDEDLIVDCEDVIYVYNHKTDSQIELDASMCPSADRQERYFYCDGDYLVLSDEDLSSTHAAFIYPSQEWAATYQYQYPEHISEYYNFAVDKVDHEVDFEDIDRRVVPRKDRMHLLSISGNSPIAEIVYPHLDSISGVHLSRIGNQLFCNLSLVLSSDTGTMKGKSVFLQIDLETGKTVSEFFRKGCFDHVLDSGSIILAEQGYDGAVIKLAENTLQPLDSMFLEEFIMMPPIKCKDGSYLTITSEGHLFRFDFSKHRLETIPLPMRAISTQNYIFDERYLLLSEDREKGDGKYLYDLDTKSCVLYLLPKENLISLEDDCVKIWTSNIQDPTGVKQHLSYTRKIRDKRSILEEVKRISQSWD